MNDVCLVLEDDEGKNNDGISFSSSTGPAWAGSERDYTYDEVGQLTLAHTTNIQTFNGEPILSTVNFFTDCNLGRKLSPLVFLSVD